MGWGGGEVWGDYERCPEDIDSTHQVFYPVSIES